MTTPYLARTLSRVFIPGGLILLADAFTRADGVITAGSPPVTWTNTDVEGTSAGFSVASNAAVATAGVSLGIVWANPGQLTYTVSADLTVGNDHPSLVIRSNQRWGNAAGSQHIRAQVDGGTLNLVKNTNGVDANIGSAGDIGGRLSISVDGSNNIVVKRGSTVLISVNDATYATNTLVGMRTVFMGSGSRTAFDNFQVTSP